MKSKFLYLKPVDTQYRNNPHSFCKYRHSSISKHSLAWAVERPVYIVQKTKLELGQKIEIFFFPGS